MPYQHRENPEFSWSYSRHKKFKDCLREYYYHYYLTHNGWEDDVLDIRKKAYRLKKLANLDILIGNEIDKFLKNNLLEEVKPKQLQTEILQNVKRKYDKAEYNKNNPELYQKWESDPKRNLMLREVYYEEEFSDKKSNRIKSKIENATHNIPYALSYNHIEEKKDIIETSQADDFKHFIFNNLKVYAMPDLIYKNPSGEIIIVDWKTGKYKPSQDKGQLYIYAYYYFNKYQEKRVKTRLEYLTEGKKYERMFTLEDMKKFKELITNSVKSMKSYTISQQNKAIEMESFSKTENDFKCKYCNFKELCN